MSRQALARIMGAAPKDWIYFEDTNHALRYAAEILDTPSKYVQVNLQWAYFKHLYQERNAKPDSDLDEQALVAFQVQFNRECLEEVSRLLESTRAAGTK